MRVLILHPEDDPLSASWARQNWDQIIDLGISGPATYQRWAEALDCRVEPRPILDSSDFNRLRAILNFGLGHMVDQHGLDWWDLVSLRWLDQFQQMLILRKALGSLADGDDIFVSSGSCARMLELLRSAKVHRMPAGNGSRWRQRLTRLSKLRLPQMLEIAGDKYDGDYAFRRLIPRSSHRRRGPVVLLPSAYGNASRTALAYAAGLPDVQFLLIATRQSAWPRTGPPNTSCARLSSYATVGSDTGELPDLLDSWKHLQTCFGDLTELQVARDLGCFDLMPSLLREGLAIRDCWLKVFANEQIASVLCADEKNPYTRIPLLLGRKRGIAALACHHGALDVRYRFNDLYADRLLVKGQMEWDYVVNFCRVPEEKVVVAAPQRKRSLAPASKTGKKAIIFFSEPYENFDCSARAVYAEVLPRLVCVAEARGCELVIKLHPFESRRDRQRVVSDAVPGTSQKHIRIVSDPLTDGLLQEAWFGLTVSSTVAVDCALEGVPAFLCAWLDRSGCGYSQQFVKYGVASPIYCAEEIGDIPELVNNYSSPKAQNLWRTAEPEFLRKLLFSNTGIPASPLYKEKLWA